MLNSKISEAFADLSTPLIADACVRLDIPIRVAPAGIGAVVLTHKIAGRALPVRHYGSVDVFLEAMLNAQSGDVLVIDNGGRMDEGCIGDLTTLEAKASGLSGLIVWGAHRDTSELQTIDFPVFSYGRCPVGPLELRSREPSALLSAQFGPHLLTTEDVVFADGDGVLFVPTKNIGAILETVRAIFQQERQQAEQIAAGHTLREQLNFASYLAKRANNPSYTFRQHLRHIGGAIEE